MSNPRILRLQSDYKKIKALEARSPYIHIERVEGSPPTKYTIQLTCRGIEKLDFNARPVYREDHRVQITLSSSYPIAKPGLKWLTPIFHPNISSGGTVCIGSGWSSGGRYLDELVVYLAQMARYEGEELTFSRNAFNPNAYRWARRNSSLLPTDTRPLVTTSAVRIRVLGTQSLKSQRTNQPNNLNIRVIRRRN